MNDTTKQWLENNAPYSEHAKKLLALIDATHELIEEQNGPPLARRAIEWRTAMDNVTSALVDIEGELP